MATSRESVMQVWWWEILAVTASVLLTGAMVALLATYDNKAVFLFHGITLNAIVALFSTLSKSTLLFALTAAIGQWKWIIFSEKSTRILDAYLIDEASRGPLGSLRLLWRFKGVRKTVNIGAYCTILALAIDPFTQQLIQARSFINFTNDQNASLPRAQYFSRGTLTRTAAVGSIVDDLGELTYNDTSTSLTIATADPIVQSAIQYGLIQSNKMVTQQLPVSCATGNCTFEPMQSLAVCSKCFNISDAVTTSDDGTPKSPQGYDYDRNNGGGIMGETTMFSLPIGLKLENLNNGGGPYFLVMVSRGTTNNSETMMFQDSDSLIWAMAFLRIPPEVLGTDYTWPDISIDALECGLYYCINEYRSEVENNQLVEHVTTNVSATRLPSSWEAQPDPYSMVQVPDTSSITYQEVLSFVERTDLSFDGGFNITQAAVASISWYFQRLFATQIRSDADYNQINGFFMDEPDSGDEQYQPDSLKALVKSDNLTQTFTNIAQSLTNAIRTAADNSTVQAGKMGRAETRYVIRWPWIALHAFVVVLGILCLGLTIAATSIARVPAWKSHLLPCLAWGNQMTNPLDGLGTTDAMERKAWKERLRFYYVDDPGSEAEPMQQGGSYAMSTLSVSDANNNMNATEIIQYS